MKHQSADAVISAKGVVFSPDPVVIGDQSCDAPRVSLIRDGDVVVAIEVHCSCGEVIVLDCEYNELNGSKS